MLPASAWLPFGYSRATAQSRAMQLLPYLDGPLSRPASNSSTKTGAGQACAFETVSEQKNKNSQNEPNFASGYCIFRKK
jgi:hypothetical protein